MAPSQPVIWYMLFTRTYRQRTPDHLWGFSSAWNPIVTIAWLLSAHHPIFPFQGAAALSALKLLAFLLSTWTPHALISIATTSPCCGFQFVILSVQTRLHFFLFTCIFWDFTYECIVYILSSPLFLPCQCLLCLFLNLMTLFSNYITYRYCIYVSL